MRILGALAVLVLLSLMALYSPKVQKMILDRVVASVNARLEGSLGFESIHIVPFNTLVMENAVIIDGNPYAGTDTLARAGRITASFTLRSLLSRHGAVLSRVVVDDGEFNLVNEPAEILKNNLARMFNLVPKYELPDEAPELFRIHRVRLNNFHYTMSNQAMDHPYSGTGIDWDDLDLYTDIEIHDLKMADLIMSGTVDRMSIREKSGLVVDFMSGSAVVGRGRTLVSDFKYRDSWSELDMETFSMEYSNSRVFKYFCDSVSLEGRFRRSTLSFQTLKYFSGAMPDNDLCFDISSGHMKGPVNDFVVDGFVFAEKKTGVRGALAGSLRSVTDFGNAVMDVDGRRMVFTTNSLSSMIAEFTGNDVLGGMRDYAKGMGFTSNLWAKGSINDLDAGISSLTGVGSILAQVHLKDIANGLTPSISGSLTTRKLNLGDILGISLLGEADLGLKGSALLFKGNPHVSLDSLNVERLTLAGYGYSGIYAKGGFDNGAPYGAVVIDDPNLKVLVSGKDLKYSADIARADLRALNLDRRGGRSDLSLYLDAALRKGEAGQGATVDIRNLRLTNDAGGHDIGAIRIAASRTGAGERLELNSSFAEVEVGTRGRIADIAKDIQYASTRRELYDLYTDVPENRACNDCSIRLNLYDTRDLLSFVMPDLYVSNNTGVDLNVVRGRLDASLTSQRIALGEKYLKDIRLSADNGEGSLNLHANSDEVRLGAVTLGRAEIRACADDNSFATRLEFSLPGDDRSSICLDGRLDRISTDTLSVRVIPHDSYVRIGNDRWDIASEGVEYRGGVIIADNLEMTSGRQSINLSGGINPGGHDSFRMNMENLDLGIIETLSGIRTGVSGRLNGKALLTSPTRERLELMTSFVSDSLRIAGEPAGSFRIGSYWDDADKKLNLLLQNNTDDCQTINARAAYHPEGKRLEGTAKLDGMRLAMLKPLLTGIFDDINGSLSGSVSFDGPVDNLAISGKDTRIDTAGIRIAFTKAEYRIDGPFDVSEDGISLQDLSIRDTQQGSASVSGRLTNLFGGLRMDVSASLENLLVLDASEEDNSGIYGTLATSGMVRVTGPADSLRIAADISTQGSGSIHVALGTTSIQGRSELLTFAGKPEVYLDPYEDMMLRRAEKQSVSRNELAIGARIRISPEVTAFADIDKSTGNVISATGTGDIDIEMNTAQNRIQVNGDYNISGGNYHFAVPGIVTKDLSISDGSSIKFGGDLMESQLDIRTVYTTRTSLSTLTADTTSVATRRQVNCALNISDKLRNPKISFSIDVPDLDPVTKTQVEGALNTEDKIQKQFISLLLFNSFLPAESSGIVNNSPGMLVANVAEVMSGQLNNILQKLGIPLDFGFGYQQNTAGTDMFDVAVSTQLFNNRVIVGGSVGNRQYSTSSSANGEMVGDLDIEIKLNKSGQVRLKLFSHSADEYTNYLDFTQRNGVGITYQKEYNRISELFCRRKAAQGTLPQKRRTITVER